MPKDSLRDKLDGNELDLSMSNLEVVPVKELAALPKATQLDLSCNRLTVLPDAFCTLTHIIRLDVSKNGLTELPKDFGHLDNLQHLDLLGNSLTTLPRSFCHLRKLKWLDLKDNPLEDGLKKNAGDCLDEAQCRKCATRILMYMKDLDSQLERQWQKKLQKKRGMCVYIWYAFCSVSVCLSAWVLHA
ncbi:leucine-rich repeat-containing protein 59 [Aplysia californica]|uniref:Leucine-rich repeat-containing protein 59 n=1 Tax=Aplysia californica TaxID=6500 RepID=A0ABM1ADK1_APLCA|nr:leucine-rich repeat-containing protein 59 [Aplysia californica]